MGNVVYIVDSGRGRTAAQSLDTPLPVHERPRVEDGARSGRSNVVTSLTVFVEGDDNPVKTLGEVHQPDNIETTQTGLLADRGSRIKPTVPRRLRRPQRDDRAPVVRPVLGNPGRWWRRSINRPTRDPPMSIPPMSRHSCLRPSRSAREPGRLGDDRHRRCLGGVRLRRVPDQHPGAHAVGGEGGGSGHLPRFRQPSRLHLQARRRTAAPDPDPRDLAAPNERRGGALRGALSLLHQGFASRYARVVRLLCPGGLDSGRGGLSQLRVGERRGSELLLGLRHASRRRRGCRGPQDRHHPVLRRDGLDRARRAARPRVDAQGHGPLLRDDAHRYRTPRGLGREVHRGRGDGRVRHPAAARGRRAPSGPRRCRHARSARGPQPRARARPRGPPGLPDRREHRGGPRGCRFERLRSRHRRRREHGRAARGRRRPRRDPDRRRRPTLWYAMPSRPSWSNHSHSKGRPSSSSPIG